MFWLIYLEFILSNELQHTNEIEWSGNKAVPEWSDNNVCF